MLSNKLYDVLKYLAIIGLPALKKFIPNTFAIWGIPYGEQIGETLNEVAILIGALICVSTIKYNIDQKKQEELAEYNNYDTEDRG